MPRAFRLIETLGEGSFGAVHLAEVAGGEGFVQRLAKALASIGWDGLSERDA